MEDHTQRVPWAWGGSDSVWGTNLFAEGLGGGGDGRALQTSRTFARVQLGSSFFGTHTRLAIKITCNEKNTGIVGGVYKPSTNHL